MIVRVMENGGVGREGLGGPWRKSQHLRPNGAVPPARSGPGGVHSEGCMASRPCTRIPGPAPEESQWGLCSQAGRPAETHLPLLVPTPQVLPALGPRLCPQSQRHHTEKDLCWRTPWCKEKTGI